MPKSILIPVALDHEPLVDAKIATARQMLEHGGKITLVTVLEQIPGFAAEFVTVKSENHLTAKVMDSHKALAAGAEGALTARSQLGNLEYASSSSRAIWALT